MLFTIDPSIKALGWALFDLDSTWIDSGFLRNNISATDHWIRAIDAQRHQIVSLLHRRPPRHIAIELPEHFGASSGRSAAAQNSGAIMKLVACTFTLREAARSAVPQAKIHMIPVRVWKGQTKKPQTLHRIRRRFPSIPPSHLEDNNEVDALGIGDWVLTKSTLLAR